MDVECRGEAKRDFELERAPVSSEWRGFSASDRSVLALLVGVPVPECDGSPPLLALRR
jgi:hypothetical protein